MFRKIISILVLVPIAIVLISLSVANRNPVTMSFDPINVDAPIFALTQPMFVFLFAALAIGVVLGSCLTWLHQGKYRRSLRAEKSNLAATRNEMETLKKQSGINTAIEIAPGLPMVPSN